MPFNESKKILQSLYPKITQNELEEFKRIHNEKGIEQLEQKSQIEENDTSNPKELPDEGDLFTELGIDLIRNLPITKRLSKCKEIEKNFNTTPVVLVRGVRGSGKTSFGDSFKKYSRDSNKKVININLKRTSNPKELDNIFQKHLGSSDFDSLTEKDIYLILDEIQDIYNTDIFGKFWDKIKTFIEKFPDNGAKLKILMLSNYARDSNDMRCISPPFIKVKKEIGFLFCNEEEMNEIHENFNREVRRYQGFKDLNLPEFIKKKIFELSGGHIGVIHKYYYLLWQQYRDGKWKQNELTNEKLFYLLLSYDINEYIFAYRGFKGYKTIIQNPEHREILLQLLSKEYIETNNADVEPILTLRQSGVVIPTNEVQDKFTFSFPIMISLFSRLLLSRNCSTDPRRWKSTDFSDFFLESSKLLSSKKLINNLSITQDGTKLREAAIHDELIGTFTSLIPKEEIFFNVIRNVLNPFISKNTGTDFFKLNGSLDLFVNSTRNWAIEVLVENNDPYEHLYRMIEGKYSNCGYNQGIVLHYILKSNVEKKKGLPKGMWNIVLEDDLKSGVIIPWDEKGTSNKEETMYNPKSQTYDKKIVGTSDWEVYFKRSKDDKIDLPSKDGRVYFNIKGYFASPINFQLSN